MPTPQPNAPAASPPVPAPSSRLMSVDALRGFIMFWIIGADALFYALDKISDRGIIKFFATQLDHAAWEGFRFYDLIFPTFVFIIGVSLVFSLSRAVAAEGKSKTALRILKRSVILYCLGILYYNGFAGPFEKIRLLGVLQRLSLCYLFAGLAFVYLKPKALVALCASLLVGYWAMMTFIPVPGLGAGHFEERRNLANWIDSQYLPLRKWDGDHDPEGLLSTLPAIGSCLLGVFAGLLLQNKTVADRKKVNWLVMAGVLSVAAGFIWGLRFPVIKKIWTSSYVLVAGGFSALLLAGFFLVVDVWKRRQWCQPFVWIGMNSITIYILSEIIEFDKLAARFAGGRIKLFFDTAVTPGVGDLVLACVGLGICFVIVRFLYQRKIFLKV